MNSGLLFLLASATAFRVTRLVTTDFVLEPQRSWLEQRCHKRQWEALAYMLRCPWCVGVYVAVLTVGLIGRWVSMPLPALQMLAVAGVVGLASGRVENA